MVLKWKTAKPLWCW